MKFTKEDACQELVAKLTAKGEKLNLSNRSINEQIEALLPLIANDEMELNDFVTKVLPIVRTADANVRNDVSQGIREYKDANPPIDPLKPKTEPKDVNQELLNRLEALEKKNKDAETALKNQATKASLSSKMKELGIKNDKWIDMMLGGLTITEDLDVDTKAASYLELYNSMQADINPDVTPRGTGGGRQDYTANAIKAAAELAKSQHLIG